MLPRVLEPEVMDTEQDAVDYDAMDHAEVNRVFVADFVRVLQAAEPRSTWRVFDAGTGTAQIPIELLRTGLDAEVVAADAAEEMLRLARRNVTEAGLMDRIHLVQRDCKRLPEADAEFDAVMSNSIVHHIPEPRAVLGECWRLLRPGGVLFVRDLYRPDSEAIVEQLVATYAADCNAYQRQLFRQSLQAALTVNEVAGLLDDLGIPADWVTMTSDRHWTIAGIKASHGSLSV